MKFLGIDFGWQGKPSGLAALEWNGQHLRLLTMERLTGLDDILDWIDQQSQSGPAVVAVDAPTVIANAAGMRDADKLMHRLFGKYHAGCYPANLGLPCAARTVELGRALQRMGFSHADRIAPRKTGRFQIEVHPHAAIIQLFDLPRIIKYKKGRLSDRRLELDRYRNLMLTRLPFLRPRLKLPALPALPYTGPAMKEIEDQMDAVMCAYVGAHWWHWGIARNLVCGSQAEGYIVVPYRRTMTSNRAKYSSPLAPMLRRGVL
jgi:predicted RNase H-like nuclease